MSTGKRLAKRSILGSKVMVPGQDGKHYPGHIQAVKQSEDGNARYSVRFEESRRLFDFMEKDVVGPGFSSVASVHLLPGQTVYVTHNQREMSGRVVRHDFFAQDVLITVNNISPDNESEETILAKIDDVRLLESRKSARLVNSDTDFSKLADINISMTANDKRRQQHNSGNSSVSSANSSSGRSNAIEVPRSDYVQIAGSRKRRTSENLPDDEEVLSECSAAMLLMKLSCSPHSPNLFSPSSSSSCASAAASTPTKKDLPSPSLGSSSGASSFRSATPSPPLSASATDEGIVKDMSARRTRKMIMYQCTYPGCHEQRLSVDAIESHVRVEHLNRPEELDLTIDEADRDHEEEFYYTETEYEEVIDVEPPQLQVTSSKPTVVAVLSDHLDMARPAHEDPGSRAAGAPPVRGHQVQVIRRKVHHSALGGVGAAAAAGSQQQHQSLLSRSLPNQSSMPIAIAPRSTTGSSGSKFILISPPARSPATSSSSSEGKSPSKRVRDGKKCRKVYGLEQRDMWCTQCKWKKACARFGAHATEPLPPSSSATSGSTPTSIVQIAAPMSVVTTGSSLPSASATTVLTGVKAIKF